MKKMLDQLHKLMHQWKEEIIWVSDTYNEVTLTDYGTAKLQQGNSTGTIMPGNATYAAYVAYAAPEVPIPDRHSPAMDVYSTLHSPYKDDSLRSTRHQHPILMSRIETIAF